MPELNFAIESAKPVRPAATPLLGFRLRITERVAQSAQIHSIILHSQIRIQPARRRYDEAEQEGLLALFDTPNRWGKTVRDMLWMHVTTVVPPFTGETYLDLQVPCSFDFSLAATQYFDALQGGDIPLCFLFSGTVFYEADGNNGLQVAQIPWESEAKFRLSTIVWQELMELYFPNTAWLKLRRDVFDGLQQFKNHRRLPTYERALEELLMAAEVGTP